MIIFDFSFTLIMRDHDTILASIRTPLATTPFSSSHSLIFNLFMCDMDDWCGLPAFSLLLLQFIVYSDTTVTFKKISDE